MNIYAIMIIRNYTRYTRFPFATSGLLRYEKYLNNSYSGQKHALKQRDTAMQRGMAVSSSAAVVVTVVVIVAVEVSSRRSSS